MYFPTCFGFMCLNVLIRILAFNQIPRTKLLYFISYFLLNCCRTLPLKLLFDPIKHFKDLLGRYPWKFIAEVSKTKFAIVRCREM